MADAAPDAALVRSLLATLGGESADEEHIARLLENGGGPEAVFTRLMCTSAFEQLYKTLRTNRISRSGVTENNPVYVGIADYRRGPSFRELFSEFFQPRLAERAKTFSSLFERLLEAIPAGGFIVETGTLRIPGNWDGDGQSTFMFDEFARTNKATVLSIDIEALSADSARAACSSRTTLALNDSVTVLLQLQRLGMTKPIDLLYLDSFDVNEQNPLPSAIHHMKELTAAWPQLRPGSIVCIDDYAIGNQGGKGMIVDEFLRNAGAEVLFEAYQKAWILP
jgi:hypothetical protein